MQTNSSTASISKYRPDIDGLRAFAVIAVVCFHAFPNRMPGGFVGVDVFFVISGYLISRIIFENMERSEFSFPEFYIRRINRIFPSLIVVLVSSFAFAWLALLADEFKVLGKHIAAGALFISNFALSGEVGYFDRAAELKPLLHLWSLSIEEQFYIVWPLLLWMAWQRRFNILTITVFLLIASLVLNVQNIQIDPVSAYYSPITRFWELLSGGILAWISLNGKIISAEIKFKIENFLSAVIYRDKRYGDNGTLANILSFSGLSLLVYVFWQVNKELSHQARAILSASGVLGAVLIIAAGSKAWVNQTILSSKIAVWFGLISYPLYLWHWPLLSFTRIVEAADTPSRNLRVAACVASVVLAWLTYRYVEYPLRLIRKGKVAVAVILMALIGCVGYVTYYKDGFQFRRNAELKGYSGDIGHLRFLQYAAENYFLCKPDSVASESLRWESITRCFQSKQGSDDDIALIGDSHAEHLFIGMAEALPSRNIVSYNRSSNPFLDNPEFKKIFDAAISSKSIKQVILASHWIWRFSEVPKNSTLDEELIRVIDELLRAGKEVYLTDDVPQFDFDADKCKGVRWLSARVASCEMSAAASRRQIALYIDALNSVITKRPAVKLISVSKYICDALVCSMVRGDEILYRDRDHLNVTGSRYVGRRLVEDNPDIFRNQM